MRYLIVFGAAAVMLARCGETATAPGPVTSPNPGANLGGGAAEPGHHSHPSRRRSGVSGHKSGCAPAPAVPAAAARRESEFPAAVAALPAAAGLSDAAAAAQALALFDALAPAAGTAEVNAIIPRAQARLILAQKPVEFKAAFYRAARECNKAEWRQILIQFNRIDNAWFAGREVEEVVIELFTEMVTKTNVETDA